MPRLTVILPVRNAVRSLRAAVRSTLRAMPPDSELVVFDDGSTDGSVKTLDRMDDSRLRLMRGEGVGLSTALNTAFSSTDSEIVARMDADDLSFPWRFRYQLPSLTKPLSASFSTVVEWTPTRRRLSPNAPVEISDAAFGLHLAITNPVSHPTLVCTRELLDLAGGYRSVPAEDYDLWMRMFLVGASIRRLAGPTLMYRLHPSQITASTEWRVASWKDATVNSQYRALTRVVLGKAFDRLNFAAINEGESDQTFERMLLDFEQRTDAASRRLRGFQRRLLMRKLAKRVRSARELRFRPAT